MKELFLADFSLIFRSYFISLLWALAVWPVMRNIFRGLPDRGWAMGRVAMTLAVAVIIWNGAMLGLPINTNGGVLVVGMILAAVSWAGFYKNGRLEKQERRSVLKFIFLE